MNSSILSITDQENELFKNWKEIRPQFVADGIVDEIEFKKSKIKTLLILKEVNDLGGGGWDLRDYIAGKIDNGPKKPTWRAVSRWIYGISKLPEIDDWQHISDLDFDISKNDLKQLIAVNMNKSPGSHTSKTDKLWNEGNQDIEFFKRQINLYDVDLTICCGTDPFWYLYKALGSNSLTKHSHRGIQYFIDKRLGLTIKFNHPEVRVGNSFLFFGLMDFLNEIGISHLHKSDRQSH